MGKRSIKGSRVLGILRLAGYLFWTLCLLPIQGVAVRTGRPLRHRLPRFYHRTCARILGIDLVVRGERSSARPTLFVSNHSSYLDITVLGGLVQASFVAKADVARWPFFGLLARLQETVFVERAARSAVGAQRDQMAARLDAGDNLILFPEGTSSDGNRVLPFKTALFSVATRAGGTSPLTVQPVSVTATALDGVPLGRAMRPVYAWYGDMELAPHLWRMIGLGRLTLEVEFHPPVTVDAFASRKALADHCRRSVADGVERAISGRARPAPVLGPADGASAVDSGEPAGVRSDRRAV